MTSTLRGFRVCLSGDGQGEIAQAIMSALATRFDVQFVRDAVNPYSTVYDGEPADVAICTTGKMLIRHAESVTESEIGVLHDGNYKLPRCFTERHIACMRRHGVKGLIIH